MWSYMAIAAAIVVLLASFLWLGKGNAVSLDKTLASELNSKVALVIGPEAGVPNAEKLSQLKGEAWNAFENGDLEVALKKVDSLIELQPEDPSYVLLKGLIFEKYGQSAQAIETLEASLKHPHAELINSCESLWYLSLIHATQKDKAAFESSVQRWQESRCGELDNKRKAQIQEIEKIF